MTIFVYKGFTRNPEIENTPVWVLSNIYRLGQVRNTKFSTNVFTKSLLNAVKCQSHNCYRFWIIKGKPTGGNHPPPSRLGLHVFWATIFFPFFKERFNSKTCYEKQIQKAYYMLKKTLSNSDIATAIFVQFHSYLSILFY